MDDFDEDPLDLREDDGDGVIEMGLFFDDDKKENDSGSNTIVISFFLMTQILGYMRIFSGQRSYWMDWCGSLIPGSLFSHLSFLLIVSTRLALVFMINRVLWGNRLPV
jgi:hypothetical protein